MSNGKIVMILSGFPRRSETFALNEIWALEQHGALAAIFATKAGEPAALQPISKALQDRVKILEPGNTAAQAAQIVHSLNGAAISGVHGYFAHSPAELAEHVADQLGTRFGFSVHAKDARKVPAEILSARARKAACVVACNSDVAHAIKNTGAHVHLLPHGVDLARFKPQPFPLFDRLKLLAVGRLVEKKGFHVLLSAAAKLQRPFQLKIVGEGPEENRLMEMVRTFGLESKIQFCGPKTHDDLPQFYAQAHVLVAPSVIDQNGDRDGLPNVILEAMACGRPVIGSDEAAIANAVIHNQTGLLTQPGDAQSLADAIQSLGTQPSLIQKLGAQAREFVQREYDIHRCTERFYSLLRTAYA